MPADGQNEFDQWWANLPELGAVEGHGVTREAAQAVWQHAQALYQAQIELLLENMEASAYLADTLPLEEKAFIADHFHGGRLTYSVADRIAWHTKPKQIVRAFDSRTNVVTITVHPEPLPRFRPLAGQDE